MDEKKQQQLVIWCFLVVFRLPLCKNHGVKVSWDDDIPQYEKKINRVPNHQSASFQWEMRLWTDLCIIKKVGKHVAFGTKTFGANRNHGVKQGRWCQLNSRLRDPMTISLTHRTSIQFNHQPLCFWKPRISWMASTYQHGNLTYCIWTSNIWIEVKLIGGSMLRFNAESRNKRGVGFHNYIIGQHPNF